MCSLYRSLPFALSKPPCRFLSLIPLFRSFFPLLFLTPSLSRPLYIPLSRRRGQQPSAPAFGRSPFVYTRYRFSLSSSVRSSRESSSFSLSRPSFWRSTSSFFPCLRSIAKLPISTILLDPSSCAQKIKKQTRLKNNERQRHRHQKRFGTVGAILDAVSCCGKE